MGQEWTYLTIRALPALSSPPALSPAHVDLTAALCASLTMVTPGYAWLRLVMPGYAWLRLVTPGYSWLRLVTPGYAWLRLVTPDYAWLRLVTPGYAWLQLITPSQDEPVVLSVSAGVAVCPSAGTRRFIYRTHLTGE